MKRIVAFLVLAVFISGCGEVFASDDYTFRSTVKADSGGKGYWYSASITCYGGRFVKLLTGYQNNLEPSESDRSDIFSYLGSLELPIERVPCTEWDVWSGTFKGFKEKNQILKMYSSSVLVAISAREYVFRSTPETSESGYSHSASITCYGGRFVKLLTGYNGFSEPSRVGHPSIFSYLEDMDLPAERAPCKEWDVWPGTFEGFYTLRVYDYF